MIVYTLKLAYKQLHFTLTYMYYCNYLYSSYLTDSPSLQPALSSQLVLICGWICKVFATVRKPLLFKHSAEAQSHYDVHMHSVLY